MRRVLPVLCVLLACVAIVWVLRPPCEGGDSGGAIECDEPVAGDAPPLAGSPAPVPEPQLEGRADAEAPPPASAWRRGPTVSTPVPRVRFHGTVRARDGSPLQGAVVYQLPKRALRGQGWVRERAETDAEGRWSFQGSPPSGTRLCVRHPRHRTVFLDGADVGADHEHHFVLDPIAPLVVHLVDGDGEPVALGGVRVVPTAGTGADVAYRGPGSPLPERFEMTDALGVATFHYDVAGSVMIVPEVEGHVCTPPEQLAPDASGTFTFEARPAGGFEVRAVDTHGAPVREALWISLRDPATGAELTSHRGSEPDGALEAEPALPPGRYHLDVSARGYEPALLTDFVLPAGPAVAKHTVTLAPLAEAGRLRIVLPRPSGEPKRKAVRGSGWTLLMRRTDGPWVDLGWTDRSDHRFERAKHAVSVELRPGTWEALACSGRYDVVAALGPTTVTSGGVVERRAALVASVSFALYDVLPPDVSVRALRIRAPELGLLPPIGTWFSTALRDAGGLKDTVAPTGSARRREEGGGALLGPYPGSGLVLEVDDWSGRTHRFPVGD